MSQPPAPLRIMPFLHSFEAGGVERVALRLAGAWAEAGCDVRIAMGRRGGVLTSEAPASVQLLFAPPFKPAAHFESLWLVPHLVVQVRKHRPDVLFCAGNTYAIVAVLARLILGAACPPIVCKVSNSLVRPDFSPLMARLYRLWLRVQSRSFELFVGMAEPMRAELAAALELPPERIAIAPDPALSLADIPANPPRPGARLGRTFLAVGRLAFQKHFSLLIRAFTLAPEGDRLVILGDGPERGRLERLAAELGLGERVSMPGYTADTAAWLAQADALVLSSRYEGVPAVVLEALAAGVPVVATDCCVSMGELLGGGAFGEVVKPDDPAGLAAAMHRVAAEAHDIAAMQDHARRFTVERSAPIYLALMQTEADRRASA